MLNFYIFRTCFMSPAHTSCVFTCFMSPAHTSCVFTCFISVLHVYIAYGILVHHDSCHIIIMHASYIYALLPTLYLYSPKHCWNKNTASRPRNHLRLFVRNDGRRRTQVLKQYDRCRFIHTQNVSILRKKIEIPYSKK